MKSDHMQGEEVGHLRGGGQLRERDVVYSLREPINDREDSVISFRRRQTGDKIQSYVGPGTGRYLQRVEEASRRSVRVFASCANITGRNKRLHIRRKSRPPKPAADELFGSTCPRMSSEFEGVSPSQNLGSDVARNK